ncbi:MAG: aquaporin [Clostridia bacterium]|nr:aquaporin [Clostridia bacterium]
MVYLSEFVGSLLIMLGGYSYMSNITLKKTLVSTLNYIELAVAWSAAVGFGLCMAVVMGGPAYLNPGVVIGNVIFGSLAIKDALMFILMEFLAAGAAVILVMIFFWDSFKASKGVSKRGIFAAYPVEKNIPLNFLQEIMATFLFLFIVLGSIKAASGTTAPLQIGIVGFFGVMLVALTLNSTGYSLNAMRSVFSSIWFALLPIPTKDGEKVDWEYQLIVNVLGSSIGGILAVFVIGLF